MTTMPKDARLYAMFTLDFADHPKILPLSDAAFRALVEMTLYSRRMMTDGRVSKAVAAAKWPLEVCHELATNDPDNPSLVVDEDGDFWVHDFAEHQTTRAEIEAMREKKRAAGRLGGRAKKATPPAETSRTEAGAKAGAKQTSSRGGSKKKPETETETETYKRLKDLSEPDGSNDSESGSPGGEVDSPASAPPRGRGSYPPEFEDWWARYPKRTGSKKNAHVAFKAALKRVDLATLVGGVDRLAAFVDAGHREPRFVLDAERWLKRDMWEEELTTPPGRVQRSEGPHSAAEGHLRQVHALAAWGSPAALEELSSIEPAATGQQPKELTC